MIGNRAFRDAELDLSDIVEERQVLRGAVRLAGDFARQFVALRRNREEVESQADVLRRRHDRLARRRREDGGRSQHHQLRLELSLDRKRNMDGHLVAVEVRVERRTDHRVQPDRLAFHEHGFKRLDRKTVQCRRTVQEDRLVLRHLFQNVPNLLVLTLDHLARRADRMADAQFFQAADNERLEQPKRHLLRDAALRKFEFRSDDDNRTARIVHALAEQVLPEAARLALQNLGEGLERAVAGTRDRTPVAAVVEDRVHRLLQHALFIADNDIRRLERQKVAQTVVAVDDAPVQIVQIGRREFAAFQRNERAQFRRNDRERVQNHPFGVGL